MKKAKLFKTSKPRTVILEKEILIPVRKEGTSWIPEERIPPKVVVFRKPDGIAEIFDFSIVELLKKNRSFRSKENPDGNIWEV